MQWSEEVEAQISAIEPIEPPTPALLTKLIHLVDLTSLNSDDDESTMTLFCDNAQTNLGDVAAVCVNPQFVRMMATQFAGTDVKVATVANFPHGNDTLEKVLVDINSAIEDGAQEIDVVFPYQRFLSGAMDYPAEFVAACRAACGNKILLKVILETGIYKNEDQIVEACALAIENGADFIKTSTGKLVQGATLHAATAILLVIMQLTPGAKRKIGLKVAGGVRTITQAVQYMRLADHIMGKNWISPQTFRIGASKLVEEMLKEIV